MNVSQQSITWIPTYARKIKQIADGKFLKIQLSTKIPIEKRRIFTGSVQKCHEHIPF